jgi:hypothetical protein
MAVHLNEHADGVYLNQRASDYLADAALGSSAIKELFLAPEEWWWKSPYNTLDPVPKKDESHFRLGTALHVALLEGMDLFKEVYGVAPTAQDFPEALVTVADLKQACSDYGLSQAGLKADLIERLVEYDVPVQILDVEISKFRATGKTELSSIEWGKLFRLYHQVMKNPNEVRTVADQSITLAQAFTGGLSEVSVYWTDDHGIRQRARFDKLHPNSTIDLKTFANWQQGNFKKALLKEAVIRGYVIQAIHYEEARKQLRRLVHEGKVFGGNDSQLEILNEIAASEAWAWVWVFAKTAGAPLVKGVRPSMLNSHFTYAHQCRQEALANFLHYRDFFGLAENVQWFDAEGIWEPEDEEWPAFAMLD